ncbi:haloacid dehalogenase [Desulfuromonas versatilis]|uniref:Haloacid dehalogenase n=1 Tax=Desulfuromonas versatilis TaxID=2802975 RepID=A0ABN6DT49_9BACT|nr:HAD-IC family P-type ATPase [Desulfuromonas versatilis]BCR03346.1 haloacid dehalogenase [Desulfuromonas versatilis]
MAGTTRAQNAAHAPPSAGEVEWHALSATDAFARVDSVSHGLTQAQAAERLERFGPNALPVKGPPGVAVIFLHQFLSPLIYILLAAGIVSLLIGEVTDAGFIFAVILLNAALGTFQEWKAEKSAAALQSLLKINARVRRDGEESELTADQLVPGDVVLLESGNRVPADLRLFHGKGLAIDESLLTGESLAVEKTIEPLPRHVPLGERRNMAFAGSTATTGRGVGVVVATGLQTQVGRIAKAVTSAAVTKPPLVIRMERFARQISYLVLGFVSLLAVAAVAEGIPPAEVFFMAVALAVSAIPEGLPVAMTVALSIATTRMARRHVIVRKLTAVEGLGSCTCIASDKTGTLTVNRQTVKLLWLPDGRSFAVSGEGYAGEGEVRTVEGSPPEPQDLEQLLRLARAGVLCNEGTLVRRERGWDHHGDAMDVALLALACKLGLQAERVRGELDLIGEIPYESELRYAARCYRGIEGTWVVKGAVERVLAFCDRMQSAGGAVHLDSEAVERQAQQLAENGYRVLAIAEGRSAAGELKSPLEEKDIPALTLLGLAAFIDPLRPEAPAAVATCREAGVQVMMITGDHPATALAIARQLGIAEEAGQMVSGVDLAAEGDPGSADFRQRVAASQVFARVSPLQKLHIVEALGEQGHFTAVTGDGVNDAPALRRANIGVAMGSGTDVAKDTASIIVTDDNFASVVAGVEEGRFAYDNIRKVVYLLISTGGAEIVLFSMALLFGLPLPLLAVQLLWLNLVTNGIQDVALAFEGGEPGVMNRPPRPPGEGVFNRLMIEQNLVSGLTMGLLAFAAWAWMNDRGLPETEARNLTLLLMVLLENVHVFNCRSERSSAFRVPLRRNRVLIFGVAIAQGIHILALGTPLMQKVLGVAPVSLREWFTLLALASILLVVMEIFKRLRFPAGGGPATLHPREKGLTA